MITLVLVRQVHISTDVFFTVRQITKHARYIFDALMPGFQSGFTFTLLDHTQESNFGPAS